MTEHGAPGPAAAGGHTPSDFALVRVSQSDVDGWEQRYPAISEVWPLSPLQSDLMFHAMMTASSVDVYTMQAIVDVHFPGIQKMLVSRAMDIFYDVREVPGLKKKPSTSELLDWLRLLLHEDMPLEVLQNRDPTKAIPPLHGALLKNEQDVSLFEKLAFMSRREGR